MVFDKDLIFIDNIDLDMMKNKLFCTFTKPESLTETIAIIVKDNKILHDKIFILESPESQELICTYNIDNPTDKNQIPYNTILLHRKKEYNVLYTINSLNTLIKSLNGGVLDTRFIIEWVNYRNSILLTQGEDLRILHTKIHKIINL